MRHTHLLISTALAASLLLGAQSAAAQHLSRQDLRLWTDHILDLERRVARHGDDAQLMIRLTDAYVRVGDERRAVPAIDRLADLGVEPVRLALLRGDLAYNLGDFDRAVRAYLDALARSSRQLHALSQLWRLMLDVTLSEAEIGFDRIAVLETLRAAGLFFPGSYDPSPGGTDQAARLIDRASTLLTRNRPEEAVVALTRAISLDPGNADAYATLARAYRSANDPESAIGAYSVYLILAPDAPDAFRVRRYISRELERAHLR